ncbi:DUF4166 domain-containing protein [Asanoa iriomotensis]|uniref:DUF4166 domain-containing protein n=1 Tax=Asanoa iriomotensis TaxID=234613 RepID=A0ABQ4BZY8_9ACTN|nr:DUF4166 domain-containing protein [Asanoa iriomotensis]GIF56089.1 hypothetical protein Air01nite_21840 [Asanoa iriomotensis]
MIFRQALGADFERLHPQLRRRFGIDGATACVGRGVMDRIWRGGPHVLPFLRLGAGRHILFPDTGTDVPFTIENYSYLDGYGRETVTFVRTFEVGSGRRRRFDATMVYSAPRGRIVDFLGTHQHLAVDLTLRVDVAGGLHIRSGDPRLTEGPLRCRVPSAMSGTAELHEWYDEEAGRFRIRVQVVNRRFGPIFGYHGSFTAQYVDTASSPVPAAIRPLRENPHL